MQSTVVLTYLLVYTCVYVFLTGDWKWLTGKYSRFEKEARRTLSNSFSLNGDEGNEYSKRCPWLDTCISGNGEKEVLWKEILAALLCSVTWEIGKVQSFALPSPSLVWSGVMTEEMQNERPVIKGPTGKTRQLLLCSPGKNIGCPSRKKCSTFSKEMRQKMERPRNAETRR